VLCALHQCVSFIVARLHCTSRTPLLVVMWLALTVRPQGD